MFNETCVHEHLKLTHKGASLKVGERVMDFTVTVGRYDEIHMEVLAQSGDSLSLMNMMDDTCLGSESE